MVSVVFKIRNNPIYLEIINIIFFGGMSLLFGFVNQVEGGMSNFKEIPLLVHLFYARSPLSIIFTSLITAIPLTHNTSLFDNFLIHFPGLLVSWFLYRYLILKIKGHIWKGVAWVLVTFFYYVVFIVPIWALVSYKELNIAFDLAYLKAYSSVKFEMFATMFVTGLYLSQRHIRKSLEEHKNNLEITIEKRTIQLEEANSKLVVANEELTTTSEEIRTVNDNLDEAVKARSKKIEEQMQVLIRYANMNSHEVRAPLARLLGIMSLIQLEKEEEEKEDLLKKLNTCAHELDDVIKSMNRLLEKEIIPKSIVRGKKH